MNLAKFHRDVESNLKAVFGLDDDVADWVMDVFIEEIIFGYYKGAQPGRVAVLVNSAFCELQAQIKVYRTQLN